MARKEGTELVLQALIMRDYRLPMTSGYHLPPDDVHAHACLLPYSFKNRYSDHITIATYFQDR